MGNITSKWKKNKDKKADSKGDDLKIPVTANGLRRLSMCHVRQLEQLQAEQDTHSTAATETLFKNVSKDDLDIPRELTAREMVEAQRYSPPPQRRNSVRLRLHSVDWGLSVDSKRKSERRRSIQLENLKRFRNLSSMDEELLLSIATETGVKAHEPVTKTVAAAASTTLPSTSAEKILSPKRRANSTNSLFVDQTVTNLVDTDSIIESASAVLHKLIDNGPGRWIPQYQVFENTSCTATTKPTYAQVKKFMKHVFVNAQLEPECIITAHIYMEKLMHTLSAQLTVGYRNWEAIMLACFILASKMLDDLSMVNADFSYICRKYHFDVKQVNKMEIALLSALKFDVRVSISKYAQYYFKLRGMHNRTPYAVGVKAAAGGSPLPLSMAGAMDLNTLSRTAEIRLKKKIEVMQKRHHSIGGPVRKDKVAKLPTVSVDQMLVSSRTDDKEV